MRFARRWSDSTQWNGSREAILSPLRSLSAALVLRIETNNAVVQFETASLRGCQDRLGTKHVRETLKQNQPMAFFCMNAGATIECLQSAGIEVVQPLLDAGAVDIAISALQAYSMLGKPEDASPAALIWGVLYCLDIVVPAPFNIRVTQSHKTVY